MTKLSESNGEGFSEQSFACIRDVKHRERWGTGFRLPDGSILTCAHVYADATGQTHAGQVDRSKEVAIDFPEVRKLGSFRATARFIPPDWDGSSKERRIETLPHDFAILSPSNSAALVYYADTCHLDQLEISEEFDFYCIGFPIATDRPDIVRGCIIGDLNSGLLKLGGKNQAHDWIAEGFSGGAVWCQKLRKCVGIIVSTREINGTDQRTRQHAYALSLRQINQQYQLPIPPPSDSIEITHLIPDLLCWTADRKAQLAKLEQGLNGLKSEGWNGPIALLLFGDANQGVYQFVSLLSEKWLEANEPLRLINLRCPVSNQSAAELVATLKAELAVELRGRIGQGEIEPVKVLTEIGAPTILCISLTAHTLRFRFKAQLATLLEASVTLFGKYRHPAHKLYLCICAEFGPRNVPFAKMFLGDRHNVIEAVMMDFEQRFSRTSQSHLRVISLPRLGNVDRQDALEWAQQMSLLGIGNRSSLLDDIEKFFEESTGRKHVPMRDLAIFLRSALARDSHLT